MGTTSNRAKLLVVRVLSTILLALAVAIPAQAQVYGAVRDYSGSALWLSATSGTTRAASLSDDASSAKWGLAQAKPVEVAVAWGDRDRAIGVSVRRTQVPLTFDGVSCAGCAGQVQSTVALGTYRRSTPLFGSGLRQVVEFGLGITRWSDLVGRDGSRIPAIATNDDFTYGVSYGIGVPLGDHLEASVNYDILQTRHEMQKTSATSAASSGTTSFSTLRVGARVRLGK